MKAVSVSEFGTPEVLSVVSLPDLSPGPGEVAIDVTHAAVGLVDIFFRKGHFKDVPGMAQPPFVPGLEVAGTIRAVGEGVTGLKVGERVVSMSTGSGIGGYASMYLAPAHIVVSIETRNIDPALGVSVIPNAAMAHAALTRVARFKAGESILIHGALGGFAAGFPGMAKMLGASRIVGTVRASKLDAAKRTKLPYDLIVDSALLDELGDEKFDVIIDPVGGIVRGQSVDLMRAGSRLIVSGNASDDWDQQLKSNDLWLRNITVSGFNAGAYLPANLDAIGPGLKAGVDLVADGLGNIELELFPLEQAVAAHRRMEDRQLNGRIVLTTE